MKDPLQTIDRTAPAVPVEFARLVLLMAAEHGVSREEMLAGLCIPDELIDQEEADLSIDQHESLLRRAIDLGGGRGELAYELAFRVSLTTHALVGYALLSQMTIGDAIRFGVEFSQVAVPVYRGELHIEDGFAIIDISMDVHVEDRLYRYAYDLALVSVWGGLRSLMGGVWPDVELWFNYPEPDYYAEYRDRLPACRFGMGANQICFPAEQLAKRINTGDPVMAKLMIERASREREARAGQGSKDIITLVTEKLLRTADGYPDQEAVAAQLFMSTRTLKRKLQQSGSGFQVLLDATRQRDAIRLLNDSSQSIEDIATWIGFAEPANFTQAFRRWTGMTPSEWRARARQAGSVVQ
ncbi:MAG: AraC family transcriptional regulator ligand-binding domain-containing protein [Moraxellaceae bacterium]|nr:AraC family transcriptional regulator ligand-binding domain-containing protein [Moraxellaceae bacterium]